MAETSDSTRSSMVRVVSLQGVSSDKGDEVFTVVLSLHPRSDVRSLGANRICGQAKHIRARREKAHGNPPARGGDQGWRWGELNPRPLLWSCAFYGCSQLKRSTRLRNLPLASNPTSPALVKVPRSPRA